MLDYTAAVAYFWDGMDGDTCAPLNIGMAVADKESNPDSVQGLKEWQVYADTKPKVYKLKFLTQVAYPVLTAMAIEASDGCVKVQLVDIETDQPVIDGSEKVEIVPLPSFRWTTSEFTNTILTQWEKKISILSGDLQHGRGTIGKIGIKRDKNHLSKAKFLLGARPRLDDPIYKIRNILKPFKVKDHRNELTMLGYSPVSVLPSNTAIAPVNPIFSHRLEDEREMWVVTMLGYSPVSVLPSNTAIAPVNPSFSHRENNKDPYRRLFEAIRLATQNFRHENCIGEGGYGKVYKGEHANVHGNGHYTIVAKMLNRSHGHGDTEFYNEQQILSRILHENVTSLVDCITETVEKFMVYEHASRGSFDKYLNDFSLTWKNQLKICIDLATSLDFLHGHQHWQERIIHRDIKSSNILLSDDLKSKIGTLGLSMERAINQDKDYVADHVYGTRGYVDPMYLKSDFLTRKADVCSFGVILFEILCGRSMCAIYHQKGQYLPSFIKQEVDYFNFSKPSWTEISFIDRDGDREGNDIERDRKCYAKPVKNLAESAMGLEESGFGKVDYFSFSKRNWTEMTLLSFIGLILLAAPTCTATGLNSHADHKNMFQVVPGDVKNAWNEWVLRGLILISLISQIALSLLGYIRRYNWTTPVRMGLWCTCLLAYSVVPAALGMITQSTSEPTLHVAQPHRLNTSELMSFWAPFLFLHLGGPDSITAFALEDSELYLRYFVEMVFLSLVALYILVGSWREYSYLSNLVIFVYLPGFIKCFERILALRLANTGYLRNSMICSPGPGTNYHKLEDDLHLKKSQGSTVNLDEVSEPLLPSDNKGPGRVISDAYHLFQKFKRLFVDLIPTFEDRDGSQSYFRHLKSDDAFHIVEIELGFAFDMLYTKANVVYTFMGLALRLASLYFLLMVAVCFYILNDMDFNYSIDIVITQLLVGLAILMDIFSVFTMLRSDWTDLWLSQRNLTRNILVFPFLKRPSKQRWSGTIGQLELLSFANEEKPETCLKIQKLFGINFIRVKHHYKTYSNVSDNLKHLIFNHFRELMVNNFPPNELCSPKCSISLQKNGCDYLLLSAPTEVEFDQSILIWHIATSVCYYSGLDNQDDGDIYACRKESKIISDYLLHLLVESPLMFPRIGMVRYRETCDEAMRFFKEKGPITAKDEAYRKLLDVDCMEGLPWKVKGGRSKSALFDGCRLALTLKKMESERMWKVMSQVWIEILAYAATHCKGFHHKQHLGKGGEFLTHVWLLMAHMGITEQFQVSQGHARAKMNVC